MYIQKYVYLYVWKFVIDMYQGTLVCWSNYGGVHQRNQSLHHLHQELTVQGPLFLFGNIIGRKGFPLQRGNTTWESRIYWSVNYFQELYKSK